MRANKQESCYFDGVEMLYAILCYDNENAVGAWSKEEDDAAIARLMVVQDELTKQGKLGPVARLASTKVAKTLRKGAHATVMDGPFAETKEQLLGFFVVDCTSEEDAIAAAKKLAAASSSKGAYEVRPLAIFHPGALAS